MPGWLWTLIVLVPLVTFLSVLRWRQSKRPASHPDAGQDPYKRTPVDSHRGSRAGTYAAGAAGAEHFAGGGALGPGIGSAGVGDGGVYGGGADGGSGGC